ncbi:hypothetical protein QNM34_00580 [Rahnella bonaserana]|uniref:hypothetical protein n=1 Tax=Rahnella bonaserana TaxID=2816248 RepID=UPI0024C38B48|nr:hypothetical protein [Rahnella bonaserana]WHZ40843.1 hypothetical protein QNM34_00580 [Rahnella bonaserana]
MTIEQEISKKTRGIVTETSFFKMLATNITLSLHNLKKDLTFQKNRQTGRRTAPEAASPLDLKDSAKGFWRAWRRSKNAQFVLNRVLSRGIAEKSEGKGSTGGLMTAGIRRLTFGHFH